MTLALLWAPLTLHCRLAAVLNSDLPSCCNHQDVNEPHETDCHQDACGVVESAQYRSPLLRFTAPFPALQFQFEALSPTELASAAAPGLSPPPPATDRTPPASWQFRFRAALPPRAPSVQA